MTGGQHSWGAAMTTSAEARDYVFVAVCVSVCKISKKSYERISMIFLEGVDCACMAKRPIDYSGYDLDSEPFKRIVQSSFTVAIHIDSQE